MCRILIFFSLGDQYPWPLTWKRVSSEVGVPYITTLYKGPFTLAIFSLSLEQWMWTRWLNFDKFWISISVCVIVFLSLEHSRLTLSGTLAAQSEHAGCKYFRSVRTRKFGFEHFRSSLNTLHKIKENANLFPQMYCHGNSCNSWNLLVTLSQYNSR